MKSLDWAGTKEARGNPVLSMCWVCFFLLAAGVYAGASGGVKTPRLL